MEQIKILEIINRGGYLDTYQVAALLKKNKTTTDILIRVLIDKKLLLVNQDTRKNIYFVSPLGNRRLGKPSTKRRLLLNEIKHQEMMIDGLCDQTNIINYETELEIKRGNAKRDKYPDLTVEYEDGARVGVEIERTRKSKERIEKKIDNMRDGIKDGNKIIGVVPDLKLKTFIQTQINDYNGKIESHQVIIGDKEKSRLIKPTLTLN